MNIKGLLLGCINLQELLNYHNANIIYESWIYSNVRGFVNYYKGNYFIFINKDLSYYKKKKTILHELAHIELNQLCQADNDLFAFHIQEYEDEADRYIELIKENIKND